MNRSLPLRECSLCRARTHGDAVNKRKVKWMVYPPQQCQLCHRLSAYTATIGEDRTRVCGICLDRIERERAPDDASPALLLQRVDGGTDVA